MNIYHNTELTVTFARQIYTYSFGCIPQAKAILVYKVLSPFCTALQLRQVAGTT